MDMNAPPRGPLPPPAPNPPNPPHAQRRLHRDRANGILGGVAAGIAETYDLDVTLVRVLWIVAAILQIGVPAYIVAWIAIPPAGGPRMRHERSVDVRALIGLVAIGIGVLIATSHLLPHGWRFDHFGAPIILIGGGLAILVSRRNRPWSDGTDELGPPAHGAGPRGAPTATVPTAAAPTEAPSTEDAPTEEVASDGAPTDTAGMTPPLPPIPPVPPSAWTQTAPWPTEPSRRARRHAAIRDWRARRPRSFLTPVTLSVLLIGAGIASLLQATGALDVNITVALAIATCTVGAALVVAAFAGRAHTLILVGVLLVAATGISSTIDVPLRGGIGSTTYRPFELSSLKSHYELGIGELQIDLRDLPLADRTTVVDAQAGIGQVLVFVPSSVRVEVDAHAGAGSLMLFGHESGGWPENDQQAIAGTGPGVLRLNLRVGAGQVRVRRFEPGGVETILGSDNVGVNG
jgi:phage shock protein PspC (stress-responsive transcriptional regulator)/predicted membrane protein